MRPSIQRVSGWMIALLGTYAIYLTLPRALPGDGLLDFGSFIASGHAAAKGLNPYGIYPLTFHVVLPGFDAWNPNLNPPISAILFQALSWGEPAHAFRIWWALSIACWIATVAFLVRRYARGFESMVIIGLWALA